MIPRVLVALLVFLLLSPALAADTAYKPFVLASTSEAGLEQQTDAAISALERAGFSVAGRYSPLPGANVVVVTSPELQAVAAQSEPGAGATWIINEDSARVVALDDGFDRQAVVECAK